MSQLAPGETAHLTVLRDGQTIAPRRHARDATLRVLTHPTQRKRDGVPLRDSVSR